ncbi:MAG TPA: hypothetical protein VHP38_09390 [Ruminiclostridium sp.]|nr:hypothetical protein [Ruminiclostridium sp.]
MHPKKIRFFDNEGGVKLECNFNSLPLKEEKIIEKSIELFNDREPCIIHRSFVMKKLLLEIDDCLQLFSNETGQISLESIPQNIRELMSIGSDVTRLQLY